MDDTLTLAEDEYAGPDLSAAVVYGGTLVLLALLVFAWIERRRWRAKANEADAAVPDAARALREGEAILVGQVEYEEGATEAVRMEVVQKGTEQESSGTWSHKWTEVDRRLSVTPFYLRLASGERVRVEPTREVQLADSLDGVILVRTDRRIRVAQLTPDEEVICVGALSRRPVPGRPGEGYRDAATGWFLGPPARGPMVLSTLPLGARFRLKERGRAMNQFLLTLALVAFHVPLAGYHARFFLGEPAVGDVVNRWITYTEDDDGDRIAHYHVDVEVRGTGEHIAGEVTPASYARTAPREGSGANARSYARGAVIGPAVTVLSLPGHHWAAQLEPRASAHVGVVGYLCVLLLIMSLTVAFTDPKPWWEKRVLDGGSGKLPRVGGEPRRRRGR